MHAWHGLRVTIQQSDRTSPNVVGPRRAYTVARCCRLSGRSTKIDGAIAVRSEVLHEAFAAKYRGGGEGEQGNKPDYDMPNGRCAYQKGCAWSARNLEVEFTVSCGTAEDGGTNIAPFSPP